MSKIVGYMVTWTTYGSWLPGDKRRYVEDGKILDGDTVIFERNKKRQKSETVKLNTKEKQIVTNTILSEAQRIGQVVEGIIVYSNHLHLLVRPGPESIEDTTGRYKSITTRVLWKAGRKGLIWTKGYDARYCFNEEDINRKKTIYQKS